jgi:hypothetical protein
MDNLIGGGDAGGGNYEDVAMTLASITYCADIAGALRQYAPGWTLAWLPDKDVNGNYAYIVHNPLRSQYIVAIRGSLLTFSWAAFDNWFYQDFNVFEQVPWQYPADPQNEPKISKGSDDGLNDLAQLVQTKPAGRTTMLDYLLANAVGKNQSITVTGHSLGGNLATVFAPWLLYQIRRRGLPAPPLFPVFTFAAPPAGNDAFARAYDASFPASWRYYNLLDIVPKASVLVSMLNMCDLYTPAPVARGIEIYDGYTLCNAIEAVAASIALSEAYNRSFYSQTNLRRGAVPLSTKVDHCMTALSDLSEPPLVQWFERAGCEHGHNTYLRLLGARPVECRQVSLTP